MFEKFSWTGLIGGLTFFFYGIQALKNALQLASSNRVRWVIEKMGRSGIRAFVLGTIVTVLLQSSSATTVLLITLAGAKLLELDQAFGIILGADVGTTFIAILFSVRKIAEYSLLIIAIGFILNVAAKRGKIKHYGSILLGFGIIFFGMHLISMSTAPLKDSVGVVSVFRYVSNHPLASFIISTLFTAVIHASAATIGMVISLSFAGLITFEAALPIVLGANVGTCVTAILGSIGTGTEGKRIAIAHTLVKLVGAIVALPFLSEIARSVSSVASIFSGSGLDVTESGKIAASHLLFNVAVAAVFMPLKKPFVALVKKLYPEPRRDEEKPFAPRYLDERFLSTPLLAFAQARRELIRVAGYALDLFISSLEMFGDSEDVPLCVQEIKKKDDKIDVLNRAIRFYLSRLSQEELTPEQAGEQFVLINIAGNIEEIGDIVSRDLASLAMDKWEQGIHFSEEGWKEITDFHSLVVDGFNLTISALASPHPDIVREIQNHQQKVYLLEQEYKKTHIKRIHSGMSETMRSSAIHWDVLNNLRRVHGQLTYIAKTFMESPFLKGNQ